jgi:hypothetical protein
VAYDEALRSITMLADSSVGIYTGVPGLPGSANPNAGKQYHFVKVTGVKTVGLSDNDDTPIGVLQNKPQGVGHSATVAFSGVTRVVSDVALTAGDLIKVSADGQAAKTGAGPTVGIALTTTAAAGDLCSVLLTIGA